MIAFYAEGNAAETVTVKRKCLLHPFFAGIVLITLVWSTLPEILQNAAGADKDSPWATRRWAPDLA
ncbi:hypothetical protein [Methylotenera sp. G11]|uniref:hypothetical protein n=1 Tax=Methylotenera sp. G11 TaxID=1506585 RepID=UPI001F1E1A5B|nr:hypothetical protein [Methylotenera sp. G11]